MADDERRRARGNGEGTVTRDQATGTWVGRITLGFDEHGRQVRRKFKARTRREVVERMVAAADAATQGLAPPDERLTVGQWMRSWLDGLGSSVSPSTQEAYELRFRRYIKPHLGLVPLTKLTPGDVRRWLVELEAQGLAAATRKDARATLRRALRVAEQEGLVGRNVASIADGPKADHREGRTFTADEVRVLVTTAATPVEIDPTRSGRRPTSLVRLAPAVLVAVGLGLRRGEVMGLRWEDLDLDADPPTLRIAGQLVRTASTGLAWQQTKTRRKRSVVLPLAVRDALRVHRRRQAEERLRAGSAWEDHGMVFTTELGRPVDPRNFARQLAKAGARAGLEGVHPHDLRHSAASLALAAGVPIEVVSEMLGHSSIRVTKDIYGHLLPGQKQLAADAMDRILDAGKHGRTSTDGAA